MTFRLNEIIEALEIQEMNLLVIFNLYFAMFAVRILLALVIGQKTISCFYFSCFQMKS